MAGIVSRLYRYAVRGYTAPPGSLEVAEVSRVGGVGGVGGGRSVSSVAWRRAGSLLSLALSSALAPGRRPPATTMSGGDKNAADT